MADGRTFELKASDLRLQPDWSAAVASARHAGDGFGPLRGFRRLKLRFFGDNLNAGATYDQAALKAEVARIARAVNRRHREAAVVLHGLNPVIVPARPGRVLDRDAGESGDRRRARVPRARNRRVAAAEGGRAAR